MSQYCDPPDIGRYGVNARAIEDLSVPEHKLPAIKDASDVIDSFLRNRYILPILVWGSDIRGTAAVIAAWNLVRVRGIMPGQNPEDMPIYLEYKRRLEWLRLVADGVVKPDVTDSSGAGPGVQQSAAIVASNTQRGWERDSSSQGCVPFQGKRRS